MIEIKKEPEHDEHYQQTPELCEQTKPANETLNMFVNLGLPSMETKQ